MKGLLCCFIIAIFFSLVATLSSKKLQFRSVPAGFKGDVKANFRVVVFADLLLSDNETANAETLAFFG
jgi:hypothetical protein